jgi:hypothetical protein
MKAWILIIICLILGFILCGIIWNNDLALVVKKRYKYFDCNVKYKHAYLFTEHHWYNDNILQEDSAKYALMRCLCNKYIITKDSSIKNFILNFYNNDSYSKQNYIREIVYNKIDTSILIKNCEDIFKDDRRILKVIKKYKDKNSDYLKGILINNLDKGNYSRFNYNQVIYDLPVDNPSIDTIIRYQEIIFKYFL